MLRLRDIHTYYGESHVLHGVGFDVNAGKVVALLGRNGMGKTTLIHTIAGLLAPRRGDVVFMNDHIGGVPAHHVARLGVGLVPQGRRIFPSLSVLENLRLSTSRLTKFQVDTEAEWSIDRVFTEFRQLRDSAMRPAGTLSGGEAQMLAIARALVRNPRLLLLDEPSEGLAPVVIDEVRRILAELRKSGMTILIAEQRLDLALAVSDMVNVLANGELVYQGTAQEFGEDVELHNSLLGV